MTFALLARQRQLAEAWPETRRNKWKLFGRLPSQRRIECVDRSLSVLDALLAFYPSDDLAAENGLIVFHRTHSFQYAQGE
jgi:replication initiation protein RepC